MDESTPKITYVRRNRWTISSPNLSESFIKDVSFDYIKKIITLSIYEVMLECEDNKIDCQNFIDHPEGPLQFTTYTGDGNVIYRKEFHNLKVISDVASFCQSSTDVACRKIEVQYFIRSTKIIDIFLPLFHAADVFGQ